MKTIRHKQMDYILNYILSREISHKIKIPLIFYSRLESLINCADFYQEKREIESLVKEQLKS